MKSTEKKSLKKYNHDLSLSFNDSTRIPYPSVYYLLCTIYNK